VKIGELPDEGDAAKAETRIRNRSSVQRITPRRAPLGLTSTKGVLIVEVIPQPADQVGLNPLT